MSPECSKPPPSEQDTRRGRRVLDNMRRVLRAGARGETLPGVGVGPRPAPPSLREEPYERGSEEMVRRHFGIAPEESLGEWTGPNHAYESSGGRSGLVMFSQPWRDWIEDQTPESLAKMALFGKLSDPEMVAFRTILQREMETTIRKGIRKRRWVWAGSAALLAFAVVKNSVEILGWLKANVGQIGELFQWLLAFAQ